MSGRESDTQGGKNGMQGETEEEGTQRIALLGSLSARDPAPGMQVIPPNTELSLAIVTQMKKRIKLREVSLNLSGYGVAADAVESVPGVISPNHTGPDSAYTAT